MDWNKLLNIALLTLAFSLILQWSLGTKTTSVATSNTVYMEIEKDSTTLPNIPSVSVVNTTTGTISINTCADLSFFVNSQKIDGIGTTESTKNFCQTIDIGSNGKEKLPLQTLASIFANEKLTGTYVVKLSIG